MTTIHWNRGTRGSGKDPSADRLKCPSCGTRLTTTCTFRTLKEWNRDGIEIALECTQGLDCQWGPIHSITVSLDKEGQFRPFEMTTAYSRSADADKAEARAKNPFAAIVQRLHVPSRGESTD